MLRAPWYTKIVLSYEKVRNIARYRNTNVPQKEHRVNKSKKHNKGGFGYRSSCTTSKTETLLFVLIIAITLWRSHIMWYWCLGSGFNKKKGRKIIPKILPHIFQLRSLSIILHFFSIIKYTVNINNSYVSRGMG